MVLRRHISDLNEQISRMSDSLATGRASAETTPRNAEQLMQVTRELEHALEFGAHVSGLMAQMQDPVLRRALYREHHNQQ